MRPKVSEAYDSHPASFEQYRATDPSSRCAGCYRQLIDSLVEYDGNALESDTPQVRKYKKVIKKAGHQSKKTKPGSLLYISEKDRQKAEDAGRTLLFDIIDQIQTD